MKLKLLKVVVSSALLTVTSTALFATDHFINAQQTELKGLQTIWEQKNIPEGMQSSELRTTTARDSGAESVTLYARNVNFDVVDKIGFHIEELAATLEPKKAGEPVSFDDVESFTINIHHGKVVVSPKALSALFNKQILDYWPRPLDELTVKTETDYLKADGYLKLWSWFPGIWLPANLGGTMTLSEDNKMVYNIDDVKVVGIPLVGLLKMVFIKLTYLLSIDREGAQLGAYELVLDHRSVFPPPALAGDISEVSLSPAGLHLTFSDNTAAQFKKPPVEKDSYLWIQSGDARLYGIVVTNAQVAIVSESDTTPLRFNLYDYRKQVATGVLHMKEDGTIIATLPADTRKSPIISSGSLNHSKTITANNTDNCKNSIGFNTNCTP
jgi:hypothetical protein